ncbi:MAG: twin-arginine translocase TatA/TatE family subunit [Phycisphaerales bacterium]|nr:twin-arginine translocase TatA/TatE family subunit [Phycisphaerales bacterium]
MSTLTPMNETTLLALGLPGTWEMIVILLVGLLIFGRRLPEVGRSLGRSIVEFKKGIKGIDDEIDSASTSSRSAPPRITDRAESSPSRSQTEAAANPYASSTDQDRA